MAQLDRRQGPAGRDLVLTGPGGCVAHTGWDHSGVTAGGERIMVMRGFTPPVICTALCRLTRMVVQGSRPAAVAWRAAHGPSPGGQRNG